MQSTTYRHATVRQSLPRILAEGLDPQQATGTQPLVWLHTPSRTPWAMAHTMRRHQGDVAEIVLLEVHVPRSWLRRAWCGLWTCNRVIPPERLQILADEDIAPHLQLS
jgi:hypothetical protein